MVTVQLPVPEHAPPHPVNADPVVGVAASVTTAFAGNPAEQVDPQMIPAGALATAPVPLPAWLTDNEYCGTKSADTNVSAVSDTVHVPLPAHAAPLHPANADPAAGIAERDTDVPILRLAEHVLPQLIPAGELVTVPEPVPISPTVSVACGGGVGPKLALTLVSELSVTLQPAVPEHAPPHPVKTKPLLVATVSATFVPPTKLFVHALPQLIPLGLLEIIPPDAGFEDTVKV
jgi:hypothetical protein